MESSRFDLGDRVETVKGAKFWGVVIAFDNDMTSPGCTVMAIDPGFAGTKHVYPLKQLRKKENCMTIKILDMKPTGRYADGSPTYSFSTSFPSRNVRAVGPEWELPEEAYEAGLTFVKQYETMDPYGNMGEVLGVTKFPDGYRAVVNTYHSNT